jgi:hypothetical protein
MQKQIAKLGALLGHQRPIIHGDAITIKVYLLA